MAKINQFNKNKQKHGYWEYRWTTRKIFYKTHYINGEERGYIIRYQLFRGLHSMFHIKNHFLTGYKVVQDMQSLWCQLIYKRRRIFGEYLSKW